MRRQDEMNVFEAELVRGLPVEAGNEPAVLLAAGKIMTVTMRLLASYSSAGACFDAFHGAMRRFGSIACKRYPLQILPLGHFRRGRKFA